MLTLSESATHPLSVRARAMVFEDPRSRALLARMERVARSHAPVLITGETGTGKELVARALHTASDRAAQPFVAVNAGAFSEQLIEAELFGHEKGAFTGAHTSKAGWFETAHGGTLFLDEIGDLPLQLQVKLLRVLQEGEVTRLGSRQPIAVDVRLVAATNVDLSAAIRDKRFREDLFYRLKVASLDVPPLRERRADILPLAQHFLATHAHRLGQRLCVLSPGAERALLDHHWPGNIRELENALHHALLVRESELLTEQELPFSTVHSLLQPSAAEVAAEDEALRALERVLTQLLDCRLPDLRNRVEGTLLTTTYRYSGQNQLETARLLGMSRNVVRARLIEHGELRGPLRRPATADVLPWSTTSRTRAQTVLRIGYQKLGLLMLVKAHGALDAALAKRGVRVEWVEYAGGMQLVEALHNQELAACAVGDCPAVFAQAQEVPVVYLAAEPPAPRGTALIVPQGSQIHHVSQLIGRRVAVHRSAQAHYLLLRALEEADVEPASVDIRFEPPERAQSLFQAGEVDAWSVWDPWLSSARVDLGARVLRDATGLLTSAAFYLSRREVVESSPELLHELMDYVQAAAQWITRDPKRATDQAAPALGLSAKALRASLQRELSPLPLSTELIAAQQALADALLHRRLLQRPVSIAAAQWSPTLTAS